MFKMKTLLMMISVFGVSVNANAAMEADFSRCAESALTAQKLKTKSIRVEIPTRSADRMDHNPSPLSREYYMEVELTGENSGKTLGRVRCNIDKSGKVVSVKFET